jgi:hypothetical protein
MTFLRAAIGVVIAAFAITACSSATPDSGAPRADEMGGHVHNLAYDGDALLLGTHEGLWGQQPGQAPLPVSMDPFDVMGLTVTDTAMLASGHPSAGSDGPSSIGLRRSTDGGVTWETVALEGAADFHRLTASGSTVIGQNSHDGRVLMSKDDGANWMDLGSLPFFDIAIDPRNPQAIVGATPEGVVLSSDGAASFSSVADSPVFRHLSWTTGLLYGVDEEGSVFTSRDAGASWSRTGAVQGEPIALASKGTTVAVFTGNTVYESTDSGATFTARLVIG